MTAQTIEGGICFLYACMYGKDSLPLAKAPSFTLASFLPSKSILARYMNPKILYQEPKNPHRAEVKKNKKHRSVYEL
jgi:hypothetical protein